MESESPASGVDWSEPDRASVDRRLPEWLRRRAALSPERPALIFGDTSWRFADLDRLADAVAAWVAARGIRPGDRVALLLGNRPEFVAVAHGVARAGAVLVPLNLRLTQPELAWQLADVGARLLVYDAPRESTAIALASQVAHLQLAPAAELGMQGLPPVRPSPSSIVSPSPNPQPPTPISPEGVAGVRQSGYLDLDAPHTIIYTSGTTGQPKGAILTWGNHWWSAIGSVLNLGLRDDDRWLAVLPLFHVGGLAILLRSVIYGMPVVLHESFDPASVNAAIDRQGITCLSVVSTMLRRLLDERGDRPVPPTLRCVLLGGGPAPRPLLDRCAQRGVPVVQTYGLTETASQVATLAPDEAWSKLGSAGKALLPTELRIEHEGQTAPAGTVGEILVRGPTVTRGYVNRPAETARALRGGWLHTGDLGYLDADGYLYVLDRRDDLIISGGENVYPAEVEAVLLQHPAIEEAGVVGVAHPEWGEVPVALVKPRDAAGLDEAAILAFCAAHLARYKVPRAVHAVEALPRNAAGKLLRRALRERLS